MTAKRWYRGMTRLIASWWNIDRIRIASGEGIWLSVAVGSFVERGGEMFEVVEREETVGTEESLVGYRCVAGSQSARLLVTAGFTTYLLTGDLSPGRTLESNDVPCTEWGSVWKPAYQFFWEDQAGVHAIRSGELTLWPREKKNGMTANSFPSRRAPVV